MNASLTDLLESETIEYWCKFGKSIYFFAKRGKNKEKKTKTKNLGDKLPTWNNLKLMVFTAGQSLFQAVTVEAHHKVNVTVFREHSERSGFSLSIVTLRVKCQNFYCRQGLSQLMLPTPIFPLNCMSASLLIFLLLNIWREEQLLIVQQLICWV